MEILKTELLYFLFVCFWFQVVYQLPRYKNVKISVCVSAVPMLRSVNI